MKVSDHAQSRGQQRGISESHIRLIAAFGEMEQRPGNAVAIFLDKHGKKELEKTPREGLQLLDKLSGQVIVLSEDDHVITCYHRNKKLRN
jgi:hypothetical protein